MIKLASYTRKLKMWLQAQDHYLGNAPAGCLFCCVVEEGLDLQGIILVGRPTARMLPQDGSWGEITRLWLKPGLRYGMASEVIRFAIDLCRQRGMKKLISYHDRSRHTGCIYRKAGMKKGHVTKPRDWGSRPLRSYPLFQTQEQRISAAMPSTSKRQWYIDL